MKILTKTLGRLGFTSESENDQSQIQNERDISDTSFKNFSFDIRLQEVITEEGYTQPTPIQARSMPVILEGKDIIACAQTGTGKTAAFALPTLHRLITEMKEEKQRSYHPKVLVLVPTRELAIQVQETFSIFGEPFGINSIAIIGGVSIGLQISNIRRRSPKIVVATPGRLLDILDQGAINLSSINTLILDEADRMLDMGFIPDTKRIIKCIPQERQSLMFSATISTEVNSLSKQIMKNPVSVSIAAKRVSAEGIEQFLYPVPQDNKKSLLIHLLENKEMSRVIIFTRTKFSASKLSDYLVREGIRSKVIHSGKSQACRQAVWDNFRSGRLRILVATDLASRGIDVDGVSHVVNYDLPDCAETYIHRIGRTGRANRTGIAFSFCSPDQRRLLVAIERHLGRPITVCKEHPFINRVTTQKSETKLGSQNNEELKAPRSEEREYRDRDSMKREGHRPFPRRHNSNRSNNVREQRGGDQRTFGGRGERSFLGGPRKAIDSNGTRRHRHSEVMSGNPFQQGRRERDSAQSFDRNQSGRDRSHQRWL
jgi:ATP-dependent RNA helicase RhlE